MVPNISDPEINIRITLEELNKMLAAMGLPPKTNDEPPLQPVPPPYQRLTLVENLLNQKKR